MLISLVFKNSTFGRASFPTRKNPDSPLGTSQLSPRAETERQRGRCRLTNRAVSIFSPVFLSLYEAVCPVATFAQFLSQLSFLLSSSMKERPLRALPLNSVNSEEDAVVKPSIYSPALGLKKLPLPFNVASVTSPCPYTVAPWPGSQTTSLRRLKHSLKMAALLQRSRMLLL